MGFAFFIVFFYARIKIKLSLKTKLEQAMPPLHATEVTISRVAERQYFVDNIEQFVHVKTLYLPKLHEIAQQDPELFKRFCEMVPKHLKNCETLDLSGTDIGFGIPMHVLENGKISADCGFSVLCHFISEFGAKNLNLMKTD